MAFGVLTCLWLSTAVAAQPAPLSADRPTTFADLGVDTIVLDETSPTASFELVMDAGVVEDPELNYVLTLDFDVDWEAGDEGRILLSAAVNEETNIQVELDFVDGALRHQTVDRVVGLTDETAFQGPIRISTANYLRTASNQLGVSEVTLTASFNAGASNQTITVATTSRFEVTTIPIDPVRLTLDGEAEISEGEPGQLMVQIPYQIEVEDGRHVRSAEVYAVLDGDRAPTSDVDVFEALSGTASGDLILAIPDDSEPHSVTVASSTELGSPAFTLQISNVPQDGSLWSLRGIAAIVGSTILVGVPLLYGLRRLRHSRPKESRSTGNRN